MTDVPLCCHRCWRRLTDPCDGGPPYSSTFAAPQGTVLLLFLCPPCRDRFSGDAAREAFLAGVARLAPVDPGAATRPGLRTLVWAVRRAHLVPIAPAASPGAHAARGQSRCFVEVREAS
jgi:hypothetical protein